MQILGDAFELAKAAARDSEVRLYLVGDRGVITDVLIGGFDDTERCMIPVGMHRYGKVITAHDPFRGPGCNLLEEGGRWRFVDDCGDEVQVEVVEPADGRS